MCGRRTQCPSKVVDYMKRARFATSSSQDEWRFLIAGGAVAAVSLPNPANEWLTDRAWGDILKLTALPKYRTLPEEFAQFAEGFKRIFDSTEPHRSAHLLSVNLAHTYVVMTFWY